VRAELGVGLVVACVVACTALVPLGYLLYTTFVDDGAATLDAFRRAYDDYGLGEMIGNSLVFTAGTTALAVLTGTVLAYLVVRTDLPWRPLLTVAALGPFAVPGVLYAVAWIFLASPQSGALNRLLEPAFGAGVLNVFSMPGMVLVEGLHLTPIAFLVMAAAFRSLDPAFEDAALASGATLGATLRRVTLRLVAPGLAAAALLVGVRALEAFEVPALLGIPGGVWVFTSRIYRSIGEFPYDLGEAGAYALSLLVLTSIGVVALGRLTRRGRSYQTVTGRGHRPRPVRLGRWRTPAIAFAFLYTLVAVALPVLILVYASVQPFYSPPSLSRLGDPTLANFSSVLTDPGVLRALGNSAVLALAAATAVVLFGAVAAWVVLRTRIPGRRLVDDLAFLPIAIPGVVLGLAFLAVALRIPLGLYGTLWILLLAYFTGFVPYGMRYSSVSMGQIGTELEESARVSGAGWAPTFRRILLPLLVPGLVVGWLYVFVAALRELSASILLYTPGNEVLSLTIWNRYENGDFPELAAIGVLMVAALGCLVLAAYRLARTFGLRDA
jgi:iron(III) transport system permease protein